MPSALAVLNNEVVHCVRCPRLVAYRQQVGREKRRAYLDWDYWARPVPGFGDPHARVLVLGLAPGAHGSNRTGRPFTGDASGKFMYPILYKVGFASQPNAERRNDGLKLIDCYITAAVRCAPPDNKPLPSELTNCAPFLDRELAILKRGESGRGAGQNRVRCLSHLLEAQWNRAEQGRILVRARRALHDAKRRGAVGVVSPIEPEHRHRQVDGRNVRVGLPRSEEACNRAMMFFPFSTIAYAPARSVRATDRPLWRRRTEAEAQIRGAFPSGGNRVAL